MDLRVGSTQSPGASAAFGHHCHDFRWNDSGIDEDSGPADQAASKPQSCGEMDIGGFVLDSGGNLRSGFPVLLRIRGIEFSFDFFPLDGFFRLEKMV